MLHRWAHLRFSSGEILVNSESINNEKVLNFYQRFKMFLDNKLLSLTMFGREKIQGSTCISSRPVIRTIWFYLILKVFRDDILGHCHSRILYLPMPGSKTKKYKVVYSHLTAVILFRLSSYCSPQFKFQDQGEATMLCFDVLACVCLKGELVW